MRAIPPFAAQRLVTEGVIHLNAVCCTLLVLLWPDQPCRPDPEGHRVSRRSLLGLAAAGSLALGAVTVGASYGTRAMFGNQFVGHAGYHNRFGPDAKTGKPLKGVPHP
jgi:hypothetical protein